MAEPPPGVPRKLASLAAIGGAAVLTMLPTIVLVLRGVPLGGRNSGFDAAFAVHMQHLYARELVADHQFPVRWLRGGNDGFGSPAFYFYPQLGFLLSTAWQVLVRLRADRALVATMALARIVAFVGACAWLDLRVRNRPLAALGAALFLLSPHIATGMQFQQFSFAETVALMWLPLILLGVDAPWRPELRMPLLAAAFALLALTHIPQVVLVAVLAVGYALACHGLRRASEVLAAGVLGALMAAVGLLPAFVLRRWIDAAAWTAWYFSPAYNALFSPKALVTLRHFPAYAAYGVLVISWLLAAVCAALPFWAYGGARRLRGRTRRGLVLVLVCVLLAMTWPAVPLWEATPLLRDVQFPWRYLPEAALLGAAAAVMAARARPVLVRPLAAAALVLAVGQTVVPLADHILPQRWWVGERRRLPQFAASSAARMARAEQSQDKNPPEYVPRAAYDAGWRAMDRAKPSAASAHPAHAALQAPATLAGKARVEVTAPASPDVLLRLDADVRSRRGASVRLPQLAWPAVKLQGPGVLRPDPATGLDLLRLPSGRTRARLVLTATEPQEVGAALSILGCMIWLISLASVGWNAWRRGPARQPRVPDRAPGDWPKSSPR